jgi:hypothetical protein
MGLKSVMKRLTAPRSKRYFFPILLLTLTISVTPGYAEPLTSADKEVLRDSIVISARQDFLAQVSKMTNKTSNLVFHVDPLLSETLTRQIKIDSQFTSDYFANVRPIEEKVHIYMAPTSDFQYFIDNLEPTLTEQGNYGNWIENKANQAKKDPGFMGGGAPENDKNGYGVFMMYGPNDMQPGKNEWTALTSHEFTHLVQRKIMKQDFSPLYSWMVEGQADYIGGNIGTRNSNLAFASYWAGLIQTVARNSNHPEMLSWSAAEFVKWFKDSEVTLDPSTGKVGDVGTEIYIFRAIAMQYLYGTYGSDAVNNLFKNFASSVGSQCPRGASEGNPNCTPARNAAFKKAIGINLSDFYPKVASFIVRQISWSNEVSKSLSSDLSTFAPPPFTVEQLQPPYTGVSAPVNKAITYPPGPAPGKTCLKSKATATLWGAKMTCIKGIWKLNPGQVLHPPK